MKLSKLWKIIIGILTALFTFLPILFIILGMSLMFSTISIAENSRSDPTAGMIIFFFLIIFAQFTWVFLRLGLISFYQVHTILNDKGSKIYRILLSVGNFIFPFISLPIYYFIFIFPDELPNWALEAPVLVVEEVVEATPKKAKPKAKKKATKKKTEKPAE